MMFLLMLFLISAPVLANEPAFPLRAKKILFLGDSNTNAGGYIAWIETQLRLQKIDPLPQIINVGLSSETCSGLSEPDHPFPRPDVHERLDRALAKTRPDVVVACYGMNDGIYYPFGQDRFSGFQDGVNRLIDKVHEAGAKFVLLTPPPFDPLPLRKKGKLLPKGADKYAWFEIYEDYDQVMAAYSKWISQQGDRVEMVVDIRTPIADFVAEKRGTTPEFSMSPDGVHLDAVGHRVWGEAVLRAWGIESSVEPSQELLSAVSRRVRLMHDSWLSEIGHKRPGVKPGLPLKEAQAKERELEARIAELVRETVAR